MRARYIHIGQVLFLSVFKTQKQNEVNIQPCGRTNFVSKVSFSETQGQGDKGGEGKSKRAENIYGTKKSKERREESTKVLTS